MKDHEYCFDKTLMDHVGVEETSIGDVGIDKGLMDDLSNDRVDR